MDARIRPATSADLFWLRMLLGQLMDSLPEAYPSPTREDLEAQTAVLAARLGSGDPRFLCYVAEHEEVLVGFVMGDLCNRIGRPRNFLFVSFFYVVPSFRESGIGRALSQGILEAGKANGVDACEFMSQKGDAQWFLRGWEPVAAVCSLPIDQALASVVPTKLSNGHAGHPSQDEASS